MGRVLPLMLGEAGMLEALPRLRASQLRGAMQAVAANHSDACALMRSIWACPMMPVGAGALLLAGEGGLSDGDVCVGEEVGEGGGVLCFELCGDGFGAVEG